MNDVTLEPAARTLERPETKRKKKHKAQERKKNPALTQPYKGELSDRHVRDLFSCMQEAAVALLVVSSNMNFFTREINKHRREEHWQLCTRSLVLPEPFKGAGG